MAKLQLKASFVDTVRSRPLLDGRVTPEGIDLDAIPLAAGEIFARQLRNAEFDVSDMSIGSFMIATSQAPTEFVAFPVFTMRRFFHTAIYVHKDAGIESPADLRGKKVGVPEYQQTGNVWNRGVLQHEFGVLASDMKWFMERGPEMSHGGMTGFTPPAGVDLAYLRSDTNLGEMLVSGQLDAILFYVPRLSLVDRNTIDLSTRPEVRLLFPDPVAEGKRYYAKTGIYPINHCMVVRRSIAQREPWAVLSLFEAFVAAKSANAKERLELTQPYVEVGLLEASARGTFASVDPMAYGVEVNRTVLESIAAYLKEQELTKRVVPLDEIFAANTLDL